MGKGLLAATLAAAAATALPTAAGAADPQLVGTVGPGFTIALEDGSGAAVSRLDPGTYTLVVHDRSELHNFHLSCGAVDVFTEVDFVGDRTFTVTVADGSSCVYYCDPHAAAMRGTFTVGNVAPPTTTTTQTPAAPAARAALLRVGPGKALAAPKTLRAGAYVLSLVDRSARDNLHLMGPGVNRRTGVAFVGVSRVRLILRPGVYMLTSDATKRLVRRIIVVR